jgi:hypothetical protein
LVASPPLVTMIEDEAVGYYAHQIRHEIRHGSAGQTCKCPRISSQEFSSQKPADIVPTIDTVRWDNNYTLLCFHILYHLSTRTLVLLNDAWRAIEKRNARLLGDLHGLEWSPSCKFLLARNDESSYFNFNTRSIQTYPPLFCRKRRKSCPIFGLRCIKSSIFIPI